MPGLIHRERSQPAQAGPQPLRNSRPTGIGNAARAEGLTSAGRDADRVAASDLTLFGTALAEEPEAATAAPSLAEIEGGAVAEADQEGPAIVWMQAALTRLGLPVGQTGILGPTTRQVLMEFQRLNQVQVNGRMGPTTLARLRAAVEASISLEEFRQMAPGVPDQTLRNYLPHLNASMLRADIRTDARKAAYLAQLGHESDGFNTLEEYASGADYEWREDLGNVHAGDGRRFKGRGPIQVTGRANYKTYGKKLGVDLIANPEKAATAEVGFQIAAEYWKANGLNADADKGDFDTITRVINGGTRGREDRNRRHRQATAVLAKNADKPKVQVAPNEAGQREPEGAAPEVLLAPVHRGLQAAEAALASRDHQGAKDAAHASANLARSLRDRGALSAAAVEASIQRAGALWTQADREARLAEASDEASLDRIRRHLSQAEAALAAGDPEAAKQAAHAGANLARSLRDDAYLDARKTDPLISQAGRIWNQAERAEVASRDPNRDRGTRNAVWTTGRGGSGITSRELNPDGAWSSSQFLAHHSDRSGSWAANNVRNARNRDVAAYDFTFERVGRDGRGIAGTAQGLSLISPWDARVLDIQHSYEGSGGYGRFIGLEDVHTGLRFQVHHLDTVANLRKGALIDGGTVIGTQGGSGNSRHSYATHVDIVGTRQAVEEFVRANQSGRFRSQRRAGGAT